MLNPISVGNTIPACVTVTSFGLPVAPVAVTRIVPVRTDVVVLAVNAQLMVPALVPLELDVIESQVLPDVTSAVQVIAPEPVLITENVAKPPSFDTFWLIGVTDKMGLNGIGAG